PASPPRRRAFRRHRTVRYRQLNTARRQGPPGHPGKQSDQAPAGLRDRADKEFNMDLFNFAKNVGKQLRGKGDSGAADKIKAHVLEDNPGVNNLEVTFDDGVATLSGDCADQAAREKAILLAGNVEGVERVDGDALKVPAGVQVEEVTYYEIQ